MFLVSSIRRKLVLGLCMVLIMLLTVSVSGFYGLTAFRNVVHGLDASLNRAPQQSDVVVAVSRLLDPVLLDIAQDTGTEYQRMRFRQALADCRTRLLGFRRKLESLPSHEIPAGQKPVTETLLAQIELGLQNLENLHRLAADETLRPRVARRMLEDVSRLVLLAQQVPDPTESLRQTLQDSRGVYRSLFLIVSLTTMGAVLFFFVLVQYGYSALFQPLRKLHQGARRVAQGDFDYRLQMTTQDEMAELAESFNLMSTRFQEIRSNLDRQVQERSQQLVRSERLAGVGFLAAGVAHEINNPLSAIAMAAESLEGRIEPMLANDPPEDAEVVRQYLRMMQTEAFRCRQITERLLDFSRGRDATHEITDVTRLVSEVVSMVQYLSKYREKRIEFERIEPCLADINGAEIKQVILNLVANGLEAMEKGGTLRIHLKEQTDHVVLTFQDDGCGMTTEVLEHMFEPFFTRKSDGQGTGLGLSITHRIVQQHGGTIVASSSGPGQGSEFTVRLPRKAVQVTAA